MKKGKRRMDDTGDPNQKKNKSKDRGEVKSQHGRNITDLENKFLLN